jgi:peptidoglycan/xylan/chitin deacetylase (PgdA/CDA1 family)
MMRLFIFPAMLLLLAACGVTRHGEEALQHALNASDFAAEGLTVSVPLVTFVFDDGNDTDYLIARDIFAEQGTVACTAITTDWINRPGYLTAEQIIGLRDVGWEIMSHTATHPNLRSLSPAQVKDELARSKATLESMGITVKNIVYPYNKSNEMVRAIARQYYRSGRGGKNEINRGILNVYDLRSVSNRTHDVAEMKGFIDRAYAEKDWLIIYHHQIDAKTTLTKKRGTFLEGEQLLFSPSGARGRHRRDTWFLTAGSLHFVPLAGTPQPGDSVLGVASNTRARIDRVVYDQRASLIDQLRYIRSHYPDMRIVTIDQGLDKLGVPDHGPFLLKYTPKAVNPAF